MKIILEDYIMKIILEDYIMKIILWLDYIRRLYYERCGGFTFIWNLQDWHQLKLQAYLDY